MTDTKNLIKNVDHGLAELIVKCDRVLYANMVVSAISKVRRKWHWSKRTDKHLIVGMWGSALGCNAYLCLSS